MKKLFVTFMLMLMLFIGCTVNHNRQPNPSISTSSVAILPDESIMFSGKVYEDTYREFVRWTSDNKKHYTIYLNTFGGDAFATIGILHRINELQEQGVKFTMICQTKALSAGSYIFMMGDERIMYTGTSLMWHTVRGQFKKKGKAWSTEKGIVITQLDNVVVGYFEKRFPHIDKALIYEWFWNTDTTYMGATEALLHGIATDVVY